MNKHKKLTSILGFFSFSILLSACINKFISIISCMKDLLYSQNGNYYNWRFGKIFYTKQGKGAPLLLIHELNSYSSDIEWHGIVEELSKSHTVYTIDLLGCGRSDKPKVTYTTYLYVQLIQDFIKNIIGSPTDAIATGSSSSILLMSCHVDNKLLNKLLLINPEKLSNLNKVPKTKNKIVKWFIELPIVGTLFYNLIMCKFNIKRHFIHSNYYCQYKVKPRYIHAYYEAAHINGTNSRFLYSSMKAHYTNCNIIQALKSINNCIYIVGGQYETQIKETIQNYTTINPAIEYSIIKDTKHLPQLELAKSILNICDIYF